MAEKEYLSREDVIGAIDAIWQANKNGSHGDPILYDALDTVARVIEVFPAADVRPERHGHWIIRSGLPFCSECDYGIGYVVVSFDYCPNCGAKMDGDKNDP